MAATICISVAEKTYSEILGVIKSHDFAEIRLDLTDINEDEIYMLFSDTGKRFIATCRQGKYSNEERISRLKTAIDAGAAYVDIELEEEIEYKQALLSIAKSAGCKVIISLHDFEETPKDSTLDILIKACKNFGADIVKLVTTAQNPADCSRILGLYDKHTDLVAFAMGEYGKISRLACLYLGAPFTYASVSDDKAVANGQVSVSKLEELIRLLPVKG